MMANGKAISNSDTFVKNIALSTAFGEKGLTLRKSRALHVLALTVREQFFARHPQYNADNIHLITKEVIEQGKATYEVGETQVMESMGYQRDKYYSLTQVLGIFEELSNETIHFDGLGIVQEKMGTDKYTGFFRPLAQAERANGFFKFHVPSMMVFYIMHPEVSFDAPISWLGYKNKYAPGIYETCAYYFQNALHTTDSFSFASLRKITDTLNSKTYDKFNNFKERVIEKTLDSINNSPELDLHITYEAQSIGAEKRRGRKTVTHIRFHVSEKLDQPKSSSVIRDSIVLSAMKAEIESLGIAKHAVNDVLSECENEKGDISIPYVKWSVRKAHEIRQMKKFGAYQQDDKQNNFGGYFRKHIVRARKKEWFDIRDLLQTKVKQLSKRSSVMKSHDNEQELSKLKARLERVIAYKYLKSLSDHAFSHKTKQFVDFLEAQLPDVFRCYSAGDFGQSFVEMAEQGNPYILFYLDYADNIFTKDAYKFVINQLD